VITTLTKNDSAAIETALTLMNRPQGQGLFNRSYLIGKTGTPTAAVFM